MRELLAREASPSGWGEAGAGGQPPRGGAVPTQCAFRTPVSWSVASGV